MATTIDQKVVEMKFDNRDFERNTKQSMSTLEKLKEKLNFSGASKGLENISASAKKVDMAGLATGVETVKNKFSALEIMGVTALVNITNSAVNAGKALIKSISVDQISSGWNKMNEKLSYVQTLVNSTGLSVKEINGYLNELMWFSDETSYSFTDMTAALAQMTSTGGDIKNLVPMITGIANSVAFAGKGAGEFSRAIFNLNQSYSNGFLELRDWKSVQAAGVNSKQLTEELIAAGEALGTIKKGEVTIGNFTQTLSKRWATTEVMEKAFSRFSILSQAVRKAEEDGGYWIEEGGKKVWKDYETASVAIDDLADQYDELSVKAFRAAQEAKTFREAMDATADAVSSTWMRIFEDIFGDYNKQKEIWTDFANFLYDHIVEPLNVIEYKIKHALDFEEIDAMWDKLSGNALGQSDALKDLEKRASKTSKTLEAYQKVVRKVWHGDYGNMQPRFDKLEKEGWDHRVVQTLVNKGVSYKLTLEDVQKAEKKYGITVEDTDELLKEKQQLIEEINSSLSNLSDEQLRQLEMSEEEIELYNMLQKGADKYGMSLEDLVAKMKKYNGRDLIFGKKKLNEKGKPVKDEDDNYVYERMGIVQNISSAILNIFQAIKDAWHEIFEGWTSVDLYMVLDKFNNFTAAIRKATENEKGLRNLKDTFKGLFSILRLITIIAGGAFKIAFTIFKTVLQTLGVSVLDFTGAVGNLISKFVDFITKNNIIIKGITKLTEVIAGVIKKVYRWIQSHIALNDILHTGEDLFKKLGKSFSGWFKKLKDAKKEGRLGEFLIESFINAFKKIKEFASNAGTKILDWFATAFAKAKGPFGRLLAGLKPAKEAGQLGKHIIDGLVEGFKTYAPKVLDGIKWVANIIIETFKGIFKIKSPSKVMMAMGGFILSGLLVGINNSGGNVIEGVKGFGNWLLETLKTIGVKATQIVKNIDIGSVFVAAITGGLVIAAVNISKAFKSFAAGFDAVKDVVSEFAGVLKAVKVKIYAGLLKDIAIAVAIMAASIFILSKADMAKALQSTILLLILLAAMIGAIALLQKMGKMNPKSIATVALLMLAIGVVFKNIAKALKTASKADEMAITTLIGFLGGIIGFIGLLFALSNYKPDSINKMSNMFLSISVLLFIMGRVVKVLGKLEPGQIAQGLIAVTIFTALIIGLMAATTLLANKKNATNMAKTFLSIAGVIYVMARVTKMLGKMKPKEVELGLKAIKAFALIIAGLMWSTKLIGKGGNVSKIGGTILAVGGAIFLMSLAVVMLGNIKPSKLAKGLIAISLFGSLILVLVKAIGKYSTKDAAKISTTIIAIGASILLMAVAATLLGMIKLTNLVKGIAAIGAISYMIKLMVEATEKSKNSLKTLLGFAAVIAILALSIGILSLIDPKRLIGPVLAMTILMGMFAVMMLATHKLKVGKTTMATLGIMAGIVLILAGIVTGLSFVNAQNALPNVLALSTLMLSMTAMLFILNKVKGIDIKSLAVSIASLVVILGVAALAVIVLTSMNGVQNAAINAAILVGFLLGLSLVVLALTGIGMLLTGPQIAGLAVGIVALGAIILLTLGLVEVLNSMEGLTKAEDNMMLLTKLMLAFVAVLIPLAIFGPLALVGVAALSALLILMGVMSGVIVAVGALTNYIPEIQTFVSKGLGLFILMAQGLGEMVGAFVKGIALQVISILPELGTNLSKFMLNAQTFIDIAKTVNGKVLSGVGIIAASVLALVVSDFIAAIGTFLSGSFVGLGKELSLFAINLMPFIAVMSSIPSKTLEAVSSLCKAILALTAANLLQGITRFVGGTKDLTEFGTQISSLGTSLKSFVDNLGVFDDDKVKTAECAAKVIEALADAADKIPNTGGLWAKLAGESSLAEFSASLPDMASDVADFVTNLGTFGPDQIKTAECAAKVITALADAADSLPTDGGIWQRLFGSNSLSKFAEGMEPVANGIVAFMNKLSEAKIKDKNNKEIIDAGVSIIQSFADMGKDGNIEDLADNIGPLGKKLPDFASKMAEFITNLCNISIDNAQTAASIMPHIGETIKSLLDKVGKYITEKKSIKYLDTLGEKLVSFAPNLEMFINSIAKISKDNIAVAKENSDIIMTTVKNILGNIPSATKTSKQPVLDSFTDLGKESAKALSNKDVIEEVKTSGKNIVDGFVKGLQNNKKAALDAAKDLGKKTSEALKKSIESHSPSKVTERLGNYFGEGFIMGINNYADKAKTASEGIGAEAKRGLSSAIARISSLMSSDMDTTPTIRPVLDISDVTDGVGQINSMFNNPSLGLTANLNAIHSGMAAKSQNGTTNDVISAIKDLSNNLSGRTGDTYNINGITYDDGSSISNAVETLIRAANIERRI